jgi:hypothetical protein
MKDFFWLTLKDNGTGTGYSASGIRESIKGFLCPVSCLRIQGKL